MNTTNRIVTPSTVRGHRATTRYRPRREAPQRRKSATGARTGGAAGLFARRARPPALKDSPSIVPAVVDSRTRVVAPTLHETQSHRVGPGGPPQEVMRTLHIRSPPGLCHQPARGNITNTNTPSALPTDKANKCFLLQRPHETSARWRPLEILHEAHSMSSLPPPIWMACEASSSYFTPRPLKHTSSPNPCPVLPRST